MQPSSPTSSSNRWQSHSKRPSLERLLPSSPLFRSHRQSLSLSTISELSPRSFVESNRGFLYVAVASACFVFINAIVALLGNDEDAKVPTSELMFSRMFLTMLFCWLTLWWKEDPHPILGPPEVRRLLVVRGVVGFFGIASNYYALLWLPISEVTTVFFLTPLFTGIAAALILSEPYKSLEAVAAIVSLTSVALIAKPSFIFGESVSAPIMVDGRPVTEAERLNAIGVLLIGVLGGTGAYLTIRAIGNRATALHSLAYFSYYSCIVSIIFMIIFPSQHPVVPKSISFLLLLGAIGVLGFIAQVLLTRGLQIEKAGRATSASYLQLPIALILDRVVFDQTPDLLSFLGSFLILSAALTVMWSKSHSTNLEDAQAEDAESVVGTPLTASHRYSAVSQEVTYADPGQDLDATGATGATTAVEQRLLDEEMPQEEHERSKSSPQ